MSNPSRRKSPGTISFRRLLDGGCAVALLLLALARPDVVLAEGRSLGDTLSAEPNPSVEAGASPISVPRPFILEPGDRPLPDFTFREVMPDGETREWGFVEFKGRPIIAVSWATWCGVCRRDLPRLDRLQAHLADEDFLIATMSIDDLAPARVEKELRARGQKRLRVFHDTDKLFFLSTSGVGVPSAVIANRDGKVVARAQGSVRWNDPDVIEFVRRITQSPESSPTIAARPPELSAPLSLRKLRKP